MNKRKVSYAKLHTELFTPHAGSYGTTLVETGGPSLKPVEMFILDNGDLECWIKGKEIIVSSTNLAYVVPYPAETPKVSPIKK